MIELKNIQITYDSLIVSIDHLKFESGHIYGIFGESGSGKTSILNVLFGNYVINSGEYLLNNECLRDVKSFAKKHISYILQNPIFLDDLTCWENIELQLSLTNANLKVEEILRLVQLDIDKKVYPQMLSGGQKQKLALAVALAKDSEIVLCDEITASLDVQSRNEILKLLKNLASSLNICIIISSHDELVKDICNTVYKIVNKVVVMTETDNVNSSIMEIKNTVNKLSIKSKWKLFIGPYKKYKFKQFLKLFLLGLTSSLVVIGIHAATQYTNHFKLYHNFLDKNISYVHHSDKLNLYLPDSDPFTEDDYEFLKNYNGIETIYPYIPLERRLNINEISAYLKTELNEDLENLEGKLIRRNKKAFDFRLSFNGAEEKFEDPRKGLEGATVNNYLAPYYEEMDLESKCISSIEDEGIYITYDLANLMGIKKVEKNMLLSYTVSVPVSRILIQSDGSQISNIIYKNIEIELPIKGILNKRYYQMSSEVDAYADYEYLTELINNVTSELSFPDQVTVTSNEITNDLLSNIGYTNDFIQFINTILEEHESCTISFKPIGVTTYFIETTDEVVLSNFLSEFRAIDRNVSINNAVSSSEETSTLFLSKEKFISMYVFVILVVIIILCFLYGLLSRKEIQKEKKVLYNMGLSKKKMWEYSLYSIMMLWLMLLITGGVILTILYILFIKLNIIVRGMGFEQAIIKSVLQYIGLTGFISIIQNIGRFYYDSN